jgi:hypothetical protein
MPRHQALAVFAHRAHAGGARCGTKSSALGRAVVDQRAHLVVTTISS